jgi:hypothetical protein
MILALVWLVWATLLAGIAAAGLAVARVAVWVRNRKRGKVPARCPDGRPLTVPERERMDLIERGYARSAPEPGWSK